MSDVDRLLAGRQLIDAYRVRHAADPTLDESAQLLADIQKLGYSGIQAFYDFNRQLCWEEYDKRCTLEGECDLCAGYRGTPTCRKVHGNASCAAMGTPATKDDFKRGLFHAMKTKSLAAGSTKITFSMDKYRKLKADGKTVQTFCPPGHGIRGGKMEPFDFDVFWS